MIQPDSWVLKVISQGFLLEFTPPPGDCPVRLSVLPMDQVKRSVLSDDSQQTVRQERHYRIHPPYAPGFWSTFS